MGEDGGADRDAVFLVHRDEPARFEIQHAQRIDD